MMWAELLDAVLWLFALGVSGVLGTIVCRRRDLPARLFLGMVLSLMVLQLCQLAGTVVQILSWWNPGPGSTTLANLVESLWPVDTAALVAFGALTLHLFLIFPTESRFIRAWRWSAGFIYVPAAFLAARVLSHLPLADAAYQALWGLERWGIADNAPQYLFVIVALSLSIVRLALIYFSRATPLVRQQVAWIFWGFLVGSGLAIVTDYLPRATDLPRLAGQVPGLDQLPTLIMMGAFALSILRYHVFDLSVIINRSVVYSMLVVVITLIYLATTTALMGLFATTVPDLAPNLTAVVTTLVVVMIALPLRNAIQRLVDRWFFRHRTDYRELLQDYSRVLTTQVYVPRLLSAIADQIDQALHPSGQAIALADTDSGYQVMLSRGSLAATPAWREGARLARDDALPTLLASRHQAFYAPWHKQDTPPSQPGDEQNWEGSPAHLFIPMHFRGELVGWLTLGPKLSELAYTRHDLELLSALADQSCIALENARLYGEMQKRATELAMLAMVSSAISSSLDVVRVLETIVESVTQVIDCDKSAIFELNPEGTELSLRMGRGLSPAYVAASRCIPTGQDHRAGALAKQETLIVIDTQTDPRLAPFLHHAEQEGIRAIIDLPLVGREGPLGILSVYYERIHEPTASELEILNTFANQATIAIENARLYASVARERDRVQKLYHQTDAALAQRVEELTTIEEVSRQLTSTLDLDQIITLVLERGKQATQASRGVIALYSARDSIIHLLAQDGYPPDLDRYRTEPWPDDKGITGRVARTGQAALVPSVRQDPDYVDAVSTSQSQISVPIRHEGAVIGIITLESDRLAAFTQEHVRFVELLADHAAIGIHNARLFQQVTEGRDRLQAILNSTHDAVIMLDRQGQTVLLNPQVGEMLGPDVEQWLRSTNLLDLAEVLDSDLLQFTDLDLSEMAATIRRTREQMDEVVDLAFSFQVGEKRHFIEGSAAPVVGATGVALGRVVVLRDVTRRQELELFREDLISMVVHNLQGPLAALITSLEILVFDGTDDTAMSNELLRIALQSGQKLYGRIDSLLDIRRLEDKKMPIAPYRLPLPGIIEMVVDEYRPVATSAGITLTTDLAPVLPALMVDEDMISRVFSNLLDNAFKYTPQGGEIEVRASLMDNLGPRLIVCSVSDTGLGIDSAYTEVIFEKFRQGANASQGRRKGMGIGLYYCKLAVEAHGGRIWVENNERQGTTFSFTLPVADRDQ